LQFDVTSSASRGRRPLVRVRSRETGDAARTPGLCIERLQDGEALAAVSTEDLYRPGLGAGQARFRLSRPEGGPPGEIVRHGGNYVLLLGGEELLRFSGDFQAGDVRVSSGGRDVASAQAAGGAYQLSIESGVDAGLVLLGLLTVDKCERGTAA